MSSTDPFDNSYEIRLKRQLKQLKWQKMHLDPVLLTLMIVLASFGLTILYSASNESTNMLRQQIFHFGFASICMIAVAQITPDNLEQYSPWLYTIASLLLILVLLVGHQSQGARRWLGVGPLQIQPSEIMKLAMPMMIAWIICKKL